MTARPDRPVAPAVNSAGIPEELKDRPQWVPWRYEFIGGKWTKVPYRDRDRKASSTDPATWHPFDAAMFLYQRHGFDGIGYMFAPDDPHCGVDQDGCRDPLTGELTTAAATILAELGTYADISPSDTGVKAIGVASLPNGKGRKSTKARIELYDRGRFFTMTGRREPSTPRTTSDMQGAIDTLYARLFPVTEASRESDRRSPGDVPADDRIVVDKATRAKNGTLFARLWSGDTGGHDGDDSAADLALCNLLAFWCGPDPARIDRLFRNSGLYRPKWDERRGGDTYGGLTIDKALQGRVEFYDWSEPTIARIGSAAFEEAIAEQIPEAQRELPTLDADERHLPLIVPLAWDALVAANDPPRLYSFGGLPTRLRWDADGFPQIETLTEDRLHFELARAANWAASRKGGPQLVAPPPIVIKDMLADPASPLPPLDTIVAAPSFAADGTVQTEPGYHPASRAYYAPAKNFAVPAIPDDPSAADIRRARELITDDLLGDFPFTGEPERAHAIGLLLLPFVRALIKGPTPLHLIEKPTAGTGATLLADMLLFPATGEELAALTEGKDDDEWRKRITARLRAAPVAVLIDNLKQRLEASNLASALTATYWEDRLLGTSDTARFPVRCAWIATGNNPSLSSEIARRTIRIRLDARADRPWLRTGFRHADLRDWARMERGALAQAALTLGRAWINEGMTTYPDAPKLGMYESWSRTIGGILATAGIPGFLANLSEFYDRTDTEGQAIRQFIAAWWGTFAARQVGVADLFKLVAEAGIDLDLGEKSERGQRIKLGRILGDLRDRRYGLTDGTRVRIADAGTLYRAQQWQLVPEADNGDEEQHVNM